MNILKVAIFVFCLSRAATSACGEGCLECDGSVCNQCDTSALYYQKEGSCRKFTGLHCLEINQNGECVTCEDHFFLTSCGVCIYVYDRVPNCAEYSERDQRIVCLVCLEGYHFLRNMCVNNIPFCAEYRVGRNQCRTCYPGYSPSADLFKCQEITESTD